MSARCVRLDSGDLAYLLNIPAGAAVTGAAWDALRRVLTVRVDGDEIPGGQYIDSPGCEPPIVEYRKDAGPLWPTGPAGARW